MRTRVLRAKRFEIFMATAMTMCVMASRPICAGERIPARRLLQAIKNIEAQGGRDSPLHSYLKFRRAHPQEIALQWDPYAAPFSTRSWLLLNLSPEKLELLQKNQDEKGQSLL